MPNSTQVLAIATVALALFVALIFAYQVKPEWFPSGTMEGLPPPA